MNFKFSTQVKIEAEDEYLPSISFYTGDFLTQGTTQFFLSRHVMTEERGLTIATLMLAA